MTPSKISRLEQVLLLARRLNPRFTAYCVKMGLYIMGYFKMGKRRRGTVIVDTDEGILLTGMSHDKYLLPGGGANKGEMRFRAAIRELEEETGLRAYYAQILFRHESMSHQHTVVLVKTKGTPKPKNEIKYINYFKPSKNINISQGTKEIIEKYYLWKKGKLKE